MISSITIPSFVSSQSFIQTYQAVYPQILKLSMLTDQGIKIISSSKKYSLSEQEQMIKEFEHSRDVVRNDLSYIKK